MIRALLAFALATLVACLGPLGSTQRCRWSQDPKLKHFSDVHSVPAQRYYNLLCMAYGEDPKQFADLVEKKYLPESRAQGCVDEYKQLDYAVRKLVYLYFDQCS